MFTLKAISPDAVPRALERAERYRLLAEPREAESICHDVLNVDPDNQRALVTLILALTDQLSSGRSSCASEATALVRRLRSEFERLYYAGIVHERRAKAILSGAGMGSHENAFAYLREAMACFDRAEAISPPNNDDAVLRWNSCVRLIAAHRLEEATDEGWREQALE